MNRSRGYQALQVDLIGIKHQSHHGYHVIGFVPDVSDHKSSEVFECAWASAQKGKMPMTNIMNSGEALKYSVHFHSDYLKQ